MIMILSGMEFLSGLINDNPRLGLPWALSRISFDCYQSIVKESQVIEGVLSQAAQYYGWTIGFWGTPAAKQIVNLVRSDERAKGYILKQILKSLINIK